MWLIFLCRKNQWLVEKSLKYTQWFKAIIDRIAGEFENNTKIIVPINLFSLSVLEIIEYGNKPEECYPDDIKNRFSTECIHFKSYLEFSNKQINWISHRHVCKLLQDHSFTGVYPNIDVAYRL